MYVALQYQVIAIHTFKIVLTSIIKVPDWPFLSQIYPFLFLACQTVKHLSYQMRKFESKIFFCSSDIAKKIVLKVLNHKAFRTCLCLECGFAVMTREWKTVWCHSESIAPVTQHTTDFG